MLTAGSRWSAEYGDSSLGDAGIQLYVGELLYKGVYVTDPH